MVLIPYNNEPAPLSSSDGDLHLDKRALRLESLPPGTRDSGFGASTASDMEALGQPADLSPCDTEDVTSFRASAVSSFLSPLASSSPDGSSTAAGRNEAKGKKPPMTLPKPSAAPLVPPKPSSAPLVPPKPLGGPVCPPKPGESPVLPPEPSFESTLQKPVVPKKPDILDFSKHSAELPAAPGCSPMKLMMEELSKEVAGKSLKTTEQRSAVVPDNPTPATLSPGHQPGDVTIDIECPKVETKFPNSFVASKKKSPKGLSEGLAQASPSSAFHQVGTSTKARHSPQASIVSTTSSDSSCSGLSSSFSSTFRQEDSVSQEVKGHAGEGEDEEEAEPAVPAPMPQLPYIRANHRQRLYGRSSGSASSGSSGQSLRSANIPISTPLLLHTPLPDGGSAGSGIRHFPLFHHTANNSDPLKPSQLALRSLHSHPSHHQHQSPHGLPSPSSSVSSGASSNKDHATTPLLQQHQQQQHGQQMQHLHNHHHQQYAQRQEEEECEEPDQQEVPDYNDVGASTCENCALGKCQTVYLHMPGRFYICFAFCLCLFLSFHV
ncbi:hypothetical protein EGW08_008452 [Elysia chlorotica]|uniref:Uncharacterized protein n=1 Tax=Elysia chlorotica TaxID=188477 RepID=A0A433TQE1_ELYCH|nr:hypothetical protein EGW08_008452 [Elysia chlorotica]